MSSAPEEIREAKRRKRERILVVVLSLLLLFFTGFEVQMLRLSHRLPFVNSIFFFGLMNLNIVLIMVLLFLVFRNAVKMTLDSKRGKLGSKLRTRLVVCFLLFAIIPTMLLFTISAFYIKNSFDKWFNIKIGGTLQRSIEVVRNYYESSEKNANHFARKVAGALAEEKDLKTNLQRKITQARLEYGLDAVEYYPDPFGGRSISVHPERLQNIPAATLETLKRAFQGSPECKVQRVGDGELVRCGVFLGAGKGVVFANYFIPTNLATQLSEINFTYEDFKKDNPLNYPIKSTYFAILLMVTLLILFSATWTGFYVARRLTIPIEELLKGTEEVARGNTSYQIPPVSSDEMLRLIQSFNQMTLDLDHNRQEINKSHEHLKSVNEELSHRRKYIEVLLQSVQSGVISLDQNGRLSMINPAASELLNIAVADLIGKPYWAVIPEGGRAEFRELLLSVYGTSHPVRRELRFKTKTNEWVALLVTLSVLRDEKKQMGVVAVFDDVTEIQKMERMLAWREVARRIAHEIKNPLTPIQLSVQRLRRRYLGKIADDGTFGEATEIILKEVDSLKTLVNEFSSFARMPEIKPIPEELNSIALDAVNLFRAAHEQIHFELQLAENLPLLELDRAQLKRALINLFDNAVAAMDGRGTIAVTSEHDNQLGILRLVVADAGCGIPEGSGAQLFEPYFSTKEGGTGLGLAIVLRIVTDHGGFIRVSPNEPKGTRFVLEFPESLATHRSRVATTFARRPVEGEFA